MFSIFDSMRARMIEILMGKWGYVLEQLETMITERKEKDKKVNKKDEDQNSESNSRFSDPLISILESYKKELEYYINECVILSFNGSIYDTNLIKKNLFALIVTRCKELDSDVNILKIQNKYLLVRWVNHYRMLDLVNFLGVGISLRKFIEMYSCSQSKSYFPYTFLDEYSKLDYPALPEYPGPY